MYAYSGMDAFSPITKIHIECYTSYTKAFLYIVRDSVGV
jgi:hypothetical protein